MKKNQIKPSENSLDNITVDNVDIALRLCGIRLDKKLISEVVDIVKLVYKKGENTSLLDICIIDKEWSKKEKERRDALNKEDAIDKYLKDKVGQYSKL